jgi:hypothetical protein
LADFGRSAETVDRTGLTRAEQGFRHVSTMLENDMKNDDTEVLERGTLVKCMGRGGVVVASSPANHANREDKSDVSDLG